MNKKIVSVRSYAFVRLAQYLRWVNGERALIYYGRVERRIRSMFVSDEWKKLGVIAPMPPMASEALSCYANCLVYPQYWGPRGGVTLVKWEYDFCRNVSFPVALGECNLLRFFSSIPGLRLDTFSLKGRSEAEELAGMISSAEVFLMNFYGQRFDVPRGNKPYHGDQRALQRTAVEPWTGVVMIPFHGKEGVMEHALTVCNFFSHTLLLPMTFYASAFQPLNSCMMPEMPDSPVLYASDSIAAHPGAEVILSDEIGVVMVNESGLHNIIFSTWYGGIEVLENLDFGLLRGHRILWLCFDDGTNTPSAKFQKAFQIADTFQKHDICVDFLLFEQVTWCSDIPSMLIGKYGNVWELTLAELAKEAQQYGVVCEGVVPKVRVQTFSMDELLAVPPKGFVVFPVLKEGYYVLIYGGTGVAKTWFALHCAIALSQGRSPFPQWEYRGEALNVLYAAGEMDVGTYGERLKMLLADQKTTPRFQLIREDLDLTSAEDQAKVDEIICEHQSRVVFLDNLSTLASNGHQEGQFEKIRRFISSLTRRGIIVFLIHHENREGSFKGSGKIELVADQSLHLFATGKGDKIELLVQAEKIRMTARSEQGTFRTEFDPKKPRSVWPVFPLTEEERRRLNEDDPLDEVGSNIGKKRNNQQRAWRYLDDDERAIAIIDDMLTGCLDDVIAANLAVRERVVSEFKCLKGISHGALDRHLTEAKKNAEDENGNSKPSVLAPILWDALKMESHR